LRRLEQQQSKGHKPGDLKRKDPELFKAFLPTLQSAVFIRGKLGRNRFGDRIEL